MKVLGVKLTGKSGGIALVNEADYDIVKNYTWSSCKGYARTGTKDNKTLYMHQIVAGSKPGDFVHHINKNPLDNRKENLQITDCHMHRGSHKKYNQIIEIDASLL